MLVKNTSFASTPEILKRHNGAEQIVPVTVNASALASGVCKAGTPLNASGAVANGATVKGILLNDVYAENPNGALIIGQAIINKANGEANSGLTYDSDMISALEPNVKFQ